jgi:hypothetical protein
LRTTASPCSWKILTDRCLLAARAANVGIRYAAPALAMRMSAAPRAPPGVTAVRESSPVLGRSSEVIEGGADTESIPRVEVRLGSASGRRARTNAMSGQPTLDPQTAPTPKLGTSCRGHPGRRKNKIRHARGWIPPASSPSTAIGSGSRLLCDQLCDQRAAAGRLRRGQPIVGRG